MAEVGEAFQDLGVRLTDELHQPAVHGGELVQLFLREALRQLPAEVMDSPILLGCDSLRQGGEERTDLQACRVQLGACFLGAGAPDLRHQDDHIRDPVLVGEGVEVYRGEASGEGNGLIVAHIDGVPLGHELAVLLGRHEEALVHAHPLVVLTLLLRCHDIGQPRILGRQERGQHRRHLQGLQHGLVLVATTHIMAALLDVLQGHTHGLPELLGLLRDSSRHQGAHLRVGLVELRIVPQVEVGRTLPANGDEHLEHRAPAQGVLLDAGQHTS